MFENAIAERPKSAKPAASLTVSLVLHGAAVALAMLGGTIRSESNSATPEVSVVFRAPPPPPPPPPPPARARKPETPKPKPVSRPMIQPKEIPREVPPPEPEPVAAPESDADEGVEGGVEGGVVGGVVGGLLGNQPPPEPEKPKGPVEFDEKMTRPTKVSGPDPEYTDQAIEREIQGTVVIKCVVTLEGTVQHCRVLQSLPFMDKAVMDALLKRRYTPALFQGKPIEVDYTFTIRLKLPE